MFPSESIEVPSLEANLEKIFFIFCSEQRFPLTSLSESVGVGCENRLLRHQISTSSR